MFTGIREMVRPDSDVGGNMSRWKTLPESLDPGIRRLVVRMRQLKDHSGLSLAALAAKTASSRSSWERYLNGKAVPPPQAVEALARVSGTDPAPLLALWEVATRATETRDATETGDATDGAPAGATDGAMRGGGPGAGPDGDADGDADGPAGGRGRRLGRAALVSALAVAAIAVAAALLAVRPWETTEGSGRSDATASAEQTEPETPSSTGASPTTYPCQFNEYKGDRYAGHSTTHDAEFGVGSNGEPIAEVQCLVLFHGFDPGPIDGVFGPLTTEAVREFQRSVGLPADGLVGPMTWQALRDVP